MTFRPNGEVLARELTLGALSYVELARRVRMVVERLFTRRVPYLRLVVVDPDQADLLQVIPSGEGSPESVEVKHVGSRDMAAHAVRLDEPILLGPDLAAECRTRGIGTPETTVQSLLLIPLSREGKKLGALVLGLDLPPGTEITRRWSALSGASQVIAAVLQSCREHEKTVADRLDLEKIARAGARLQVLASLCDTCALATRILVDEFEFDRAILLLPTDDGERLQGVASVGHDDICPLLRIPLSTRSDILSEVFRSGSSWMTRKADNNPLIPVVLRESGEIHDAVVLPLRVGGHPIGVLWADHRLPTGRLSSHRVTLLTLYASQAAAAISNSRLLRQIETLAETDPLTGVANRRRLEGILEREIARVRRNSTPLSLLMVDIDQFKALNDRFGHEMGDEVLRDVADLLRTTMRETDFVARFGGDEFVVLMPDTNEEQALNVQERLTRAIEEYNDKRKCGAPPIGLSLGLRVAGADSVGSILNDADRKMYESKEETARVRLLEALITNRREEVASRDNFVANSLKVLYEKEPHFLDHSRRVMQLVLTIARLVDLSERERIILGLAALLHDIGKISIPTALLNRPGSFSEEERAVVRTHCVFGEELLRGAAYLAPIQPILLAHHERFDGRRDGPYGAYPEGLSGESIPLGARILKIADCYDAITSWRCYQSARPPSAAISILRDERGRAFDPNLLDLFLGYLQPRLAVAPPAPPSPPYAREGATLPTLPNGKGG